MHKHLMICSCSLVMAASACAGSQAEQVKDARMEQSEARTAADENRVENASSAREKQLDRSYESRQENIAAANPPAEGATQELNDIAKDRALYQSKAKTEIDKLGVRIDEASQKITMLGNRAPIGLQSELKAAATEYKMLKNDVATLDATETTQWESKTSKIDKRITALDSRVKDLKSSIDDVKV